MTEISRSATDGIKPARLQLSRRNGFNLQRHSHSINGLPAVNVARPSIFGNPFTVNDSGYQRAVLAFRQWLECANRYEKHQAGRRLRILLQIPDLRGKNLACWCKGEHCHADVLLELANSDTACARNGQRVRQ